MTGRAQALPSIEDGREFTGSCDMGWCDRLTVAVVWTAGGWRSSCAVCAMPALLTAPARGPASSTPKEPASGRVRPGGACEKHGREGCPCLPHEADCPCEGCYEAKGEALWDASLY